MKEMGGEIERDGSLVDEGSSGEAESPGSGLGVEERLNEGDGGQEGAINLLVKLNCTDK